MPFRLFLCLQKYLKLNKKDICAMTVDAVKNVF